MNNTTNHIVIQSVTIVNDCSQHTVNHHYYASCGNVQEYSENNITLISLLQCLLNVFDLEMILSFFSNLV